MERAATLHCIAGLHSESELNTAELTNPKEWTAILKASDFVAQAMNMVAPYDLKIYLTE
jgi:hypothetical protein